MAQSKRVSSLLDARLTVPRPSVNLLHRERVVRLLDDAIRAHPFTLVTGGAGSGKTLAVADWTAMGHPPGPVAWVSVDPAIRTPAQVWAALTLAVTRALGPAAPAELVVPEVPDTDYVASFAASLDGHDLCLVLDDVHELRGPAVWDLLDQLLRTLPRGLHLVMIARHDPPLAFHRLRVAGKVAEVRAADLAFTGDEAQALLRDGGVRLPADALAHLMATTEGWAAGLRLALMALEGSPDPASVVWEFSGQQLAVASYLLEEVLDSLGPDRSDFLARTCITDRTCAPLARALTGDADAGARLRALARDNVLVMELAATGWYLYHPLLLQMLRSRLRDADPDGEHDLHRRAALWYEASGEFLPALEHAIHAADWELVPRILLRSAAVVMFGTDRPQLAEVIATIPENVTLGRPEFAMGLAIGAFSRGDYAAAAVRAGEAEAALSSLPEPVRTLTELNLRVLQATAARRSGNAATLAAVASAAAALAEGLTQEDAPGWCLWRRTPYALAAMGELWSGHPRRAVALLDVAVAHSRPTGLQGYAAVYYQGHRALAHAVLGEVREARRLARETVSMADAIRPQLRHEGGAAVLALAVAELQRGDLVAAGQAISDGLLTADRSRDPFVEAGLHVAEARRNLLLGDTAAARQALRRVELAMAARPGMDLVARLAAGVAAELELATGSPTRAEVLLDTVPTTGQPGDAPAEPDPLAITRGMVSLARGRMDVARAAVAPLLDGGGVLAAEAWLVTALADDRLRRDAAATASLGRALDLAAEEDAIAPFLRPSERLGVLLRRHLEVVGTHRDLVTAVLARQGAVQPPPAGVDATEPLTDREQSVLAYLPTMSSNTEIADQLGISVNTVKQHLKSINRKLGVTTRRDAVRVARSRGLLHEGR